jgi:hypothetical protein
MRPASEDAQREGLTAAAAARRVPAGADGDDADEVPGREHQGDDRADGHRGRALAARERLERGAGGLVLRPAAGISRGA